LVLGTTTMPFHQVLWLGRGAIIKLGASVVVNGNRIAVEVGPLLPRVGQLLSRPPDMR